MRRRGFTLTEVLISMAIIAALGAILYPALGRYLLTRGVDSAGRQVESDLAWLRAEAVQEPNPPPSGALPPDQEVVYSYRLEPTFANGLDVTLQSPGELPNGYRLSRQEMLLDLTAATETEQGTLQIMRTYLAPDGVALEFDPPEGAWFDHRGRADGDAAIFISGAGVAREIILTDQSPEINYQEADTAYGRVGTGRPSRRPVVVTPGGTTTPGQGNGPPPI